MIRVKDYGLINGRGDRGSMMFDYGNPFTRAKSLVGLIHELSLGIMLSSLISTCIAIITLNVNKPQIQTLLKFKVSHTHPTFSSLKLASEWFQEKDG